MIYMDWFWILFKSYWSFYMGKFWVSLTPIVIAIIYSNRFDLYILCCSNYAPLKGWLWYICLTMMRRKLHNVLQIYSLWIFLVRWVLEVQKNLGLLMWMEVEGVVNDVFAKRPLYGCLILEIQKNATFWHSFAILSPLILFL